MKVLDESKSVLYLTLVCLTLRVSYLFLFFCQLGLMKSHLKDIFHCFNRSR